MRVSMSAMGSVIMGSPAGLDHAGDLPAQRQDADADAAKLEFAVVAPRSAADIATVMLPHRELGLAIEFRELRCTGHGDILESLSGRTERHTQTLEERAALLVGL